MAPLPTRLVLDTSLFVNPDTQQHFGETVETAITSFLRIARECGLELYMPISIFRELSHFAICDVLTALRREAIVRAPNLHEIRVPAAIFHSFIKDLRDRVNRGLRIAKRP